MVNHPPPYCWASCHNFGIIVSFDLKMRQKIHKMAMILILHYSTHQKTCILIFYGIELLRNASFAPESEELYQAFATTLFYFYYVLLYNRYLAKDYEGRYT
jgi:hypothetical protein